MGTTEDKNIIPVPLGSYSPDAKLGKCGNFSPDSMNMRFDPFGNLFSVLGNSAYNTLQVGGPYGLGGDAFQYVRKDGTFDVVLSRIFAEGKFYQELPATTEQFDTISSAEQFSQGIPVGGGNLIQEFIYGDMTPADLSLPILNLDFEIYSSGSFTGWTYLNASGNNILSAAGFGYHGSNCCQIYNGNSVFGGGAAATLYVMNAATNTPIASVALASHTGGGSVAWTQYSISQATLIAANAVGVLCYLSIVFTLNTNVSTLNSNDFTYYTGPVSIYVSIVGSGDTPTYYVDDIELDLCSPVLNYGITPSSFGNINGFMYSNGTGTTSLYVRTSADGINWGAWSSAIGTLSATGSFNFAIGQTPAQYLQYKTNNTYSNTLLNISVGITWISTIQNLGFIPANWGNFSFVSTLFGGGALTVQVNTSEYGITWDGWTTPTNNTLFTAPKRQFVQFMVTMNLLSSGFVELQSISLGYYLGAITPTLNEITGFTGDNWNQYFGVLNDLLVVSDPSTAPMVWTGGTSTSFKSLIPSAQASGTLTYVSGLPGGNLTYSSVSVNITTGTFTFTLTSPASIIAGSIYTNNGYTFTVQTSTTSSTTLVLTAPLPPIGGTYPAVHYSYYFLAYSPEYPSRVWWSASEDPTTWSTEQQDGTQYFDVNPDDGDQITGIVSYAGVLYIFKHKHAYIVNGNEFGPDEASQNYSIQSAQQLPGCESYQSIKICGDGNLYWYSQSGMVQFNGSYTPNYIGVGFIDTTVSGFKQNLNNYNQISAVDFITKNEYWISFGHTIYTFNYRTNLWNRILFDNNSTGNTVFSLTQYSDLTQTNILSFTGNNVLEQWNDAPTFYIGGYSSSIAIQSYYTTDLLALDKQWFYTKNTYRALMNIMPLSATTISLSYFMDYSTTPVNTSIITVPTVASPDQYVPQLLDSVNGRRIQFKLSSSALQWGIEDMALHQEVADSGRL